MSDSGATVRPARPPKQTRTGLKSNGARKAASTAFLWAG